MLVLTMAFGVWLGVKVRQARQQKAAVEWVVANGGRVAYDYELQGAFSGISVYASNRHMLSDLLGEDYLQNVICVSLQGKNIDDLSPLDGMPELKSLVLFGTNVSDKEIREFQDVNPDCGILR
jgi:hypothetical protein